MIGYLLLFIILCNGVAAIWWLWMAFSVSLLWGIACLFLPITGIFFLFMHWKKAKGPFFLSLSASLVYLLLLYSAPAEVMRAYNTNPVLKKVKEFKLRKSHRRKHIYAKLGVTSPQPAKEQPSLLPAKNYSILIEAVREGDKEGVLNRLAAEDDINLRSSEGETPLMEAAAYGYPEIVRILIEKGSDTLLKNPEGKTVLDIAKENSRPEIIALLEAENKKHPESTP